METESKLFQAIYRDDEGMPKEQIERRDLNVLNEEGETPLICAVMMGRRRWVDWLLAHGADSYIKNIFGDTAFHLAAMHGSFEMIRTFCESGIDLDIPGEDGFTPLNYAVNFNHDDVAAYLILKGASLEIADELFGKTPMDRLHEMNKVDLLILAGQKKLV